MESKEIKNYRKRMGLTQVEFAKKLGVSFATVNRWEGNHFKPSHLAMEKLKQIIIDRSPEQSSSPSS